MATQDTTTAVTGPITPTRRAHARGSALAASGSVLLALALGVGLLALAVPRTIAAFLVLPVAPKVEMARTGQPLTEADGAAIAERLLAAARWVDSPRIWTDLGLAQSARALSLGVETEPGRALATEAAASFRRSLALAPVNPLAWTRLAHMMYVTQGPSMAVTDALKMSMLTGSYEPRLLLFRLELGLALRGWMDQEGWDLLDQQVRLAWAQWPRELTLMAERQNAEPYLRAALASSPEDFAGFDEAMSRLRMRLQLQAPDLPPAL